MMDSFSKDNAAEEEQSAPLQVATSCRTLPKPADASATYNKHNAAAAEERKAFEDQSKIVREQMELVSNIRELYKNIHNNKRKYEDINNVPLSALARNKAKDFLNPVFNFADQVATGNLLPADSARQALAAACGAVDAATQADAVDTATQADAVDTATQADAVADAHILDVDLLPVDADILELLQGKEWLC